MRLQNYFTSGDVLYVNYFGKCHYLHKEFCSSTAHVKHKSTNINLEGKEKEKLILLSFI